MVIHCCFDSQSHSRTDSVSTTTTTTTLSIDFGVRRSYDNLSGSFTSSQSNGSVDEGYLSSQSKDRSRSHMFFSGFPSELRSRLQPPPPLNQAAKRQHSVPDKPPIYPKQEWWHFLAQFTHKRQ